MAPPTAATVATVATAGTVGTVGTVGTGPLPVGEAEAGRMAWLDVVPAVTPAAANPAAAPAPAPEPELITLATAEGRDFARRRGTGHLLMAAAAVGGTLLTVRHGRSMGSPLELPTDVLPESTVDTAVVIGTVVAGLMLTNVAFALAGRRWSRRRTRVSPLWVVIVGINLTAGVGGATFTHNRVTFPEPVETVAQGRATLEALLADLGQGESAVALPADRPPTVGALAASAAGSTRVCRDAAGRDTGSRWLSWDYRSTFTVPETAVARLPRAGSTVSDAALTVTYLNQFRIAIAGVLQRWAFEVEDHTTLEAARVSGIRRTLDPGGRGRDYAVDASVAIVPTDAVAPGLVALEASLSASSPCLKPSS